MIITKNEYLKNWTNYKIGGKAPMFYLVEERQDLDKIEDLQNIYILGGGTNILVSDIDLDRPVVKIGFIHSSIQKDRVIVGAGQNLNEFSFLLAANGYSGLDNVAGIPGTIGGGIVMNASASHGAISDTLLSVQAYSRITREYRDFQKNECGFGFRQSIFKKDWIVTSAQFSIKKGEPNALLNSWSASNKWREQNYPLIFPSAGCWFARDWGGRSIIEKIGMSGKINNKAVVSPMFPAFILNTGGATAKDIYSLVQEIQEKADQIGERMPLEVIIWGKI